MGVPLDAADLDDLADVCARLTLVDGRDGAGEPLEAATLIDLVSALERVKSAASAAQARVAAVFGARAHDAAVEEMRGEDLTSEQRRRRLREAQRSAGAQIGLARRQSPAQGDRFLELSRSLTEELPQTLAALNDGSIDEWRASLVAKETRTLAPETRRAADQRLASDLGRLGPRALRGAAARVAAELDSASVVEKMKQAVASRRVTVRPAADGMAWLSILGPMHEVVGAQLALRARAEAVLAGGARCRCAAEESETAPGPLHAVAGWETDRSAARAASCGRAGCVGEAAEGRGRDAIATDTALALLAGREIGAPQPVEVQLVMTDRALLGLGDADRSTDEPAHLPGQGPVPAAIGRHWVRGTDTTDDEVERASVWVRRLFTRPDGRDLIAADSHRRVFTGQLRRMLLLRDQVCRTPWCDAPVAAADHTRAWRRGGETGIANGVGLCQSCNLTKEAPGWTAEVVESGLEGSTHTVRSTTPTGHSHESQAPPLLGWGSGTGVRPGRPRDGDAEEDGRGGSVLACPEDRKGPGTIHARIPRCAMTRGPGHLSPLERRIQARHAQL